MDHTVTVYIRGAMNGNFFKRREMTALFQTVSNELQYNTIQFYLYSTFKNHRHAKVLHKMS